MGAKFETRNFLQCYASETKKKKSYILNNLAEVNSIALFSLVAR